MITRWVCEKCSKKWIYPLEKCIYCKGKTTKQKGTKIKVVGITKVTIPSPMHPIIPYNVLLLEDENGNRLPKKTMKDYKIGDIYIEEKAKSEDAVAVVKVKYDVYEAVKEAFGLLNTINLNSNDKILIKPSIAIAAYQYQAVTTNPDVISALIKVLTEEGVKKENIIVAEQAMTGNNTIDAASKSGISDMCKKNDISFVDISKEKFEEIESEGFKFKIFKDALHRKIINVPIMKTNSPLVISGAAENLTRLADMQTQKNMFFENIDDVLPKLIKAIPNVFTIADATSGMQGQGPLTLGEPAFLNLILASKSVANLDAVFCEAVMLSNPSYITNDFDIRKIEVAGNELEALKYQIKKPVADETPHPDIKVIDGKACPACFNAMFNLTSRLVGLRGEQINLAIGSVLSRDMLDKERLVAYGDCAIKKLDELGVKPMAQLSENTDMIEQLVLFKKLLTTKGEATITPIDKVKSKMKKLLSRVIQ